jgi:hypothetical protein
MITLFIKFFVIKTKKILRKREWLLPYLLQICNTDALQKQVLLYRLNPLKVDLIPLAYYFIAAI